MAYSDDRKNLFSMWYDFSNGIGKQLLDMSNMGNLNYTKLSDSWKGYSERINDQIVKLMGFDDNYYKDVWQLWSEFSETMNKQLSNMGSYEPTNYSQWYEYVLDYGDKFSKDFTNAIQKQFGQTSDLYDMNELWLRTFNLSDDQRQKILDSTKAISNYWFEVLNHATELIKDYSTYDKNTDLANRYQEFYNSWAKSYTELMENFTNLTPMELWKDFKPDEDFLGLGLVQKFIKENLKLYNVNNQYEYDSLYKELDHLKEEVENLTKQLDEYKNKGESSYKGRRRRK